MKLTTQIKNSGFVIKSLYITNAILAITFLFSKLSAYNTDINNDCIYSISYEVETNEYLKLADGYSLSDLTDMEIIKFQKTSSKKRVEKCYSRKDGLKTTIYNLVPKNTKKKWMPKIAKIEIDKNGMKTFDSKGKVTKDLKHDKNKKDKYKDIESLYKVQKKVKFKHLSSDEIDDLRNQGYLIHSLGSNKYSLLKDKKRVIYDPDHKKYTEETLDESGGKIKKITKKYKSVDVENLYRSEVTQNVPEYTETETSISLLNGTCGEMVRAQEYSNYNISETNYFRRGGEDDTSLYQPLTPIKIKVAPNPAFDRLTIEIPGINLEEEVSIEIINQLGQLVYQSKNWPQSTQFLLPIEDYSPGVYFLKIAQENLVASEKFVVK